MKQTPRHFVGLAMLLALASITGCSDLLLDEMGRLAYEANRPVISPANGSVISAHEDISLNFDRSLSPGAISLGGDIIEAAPGQTWTDRTLRLNASNAVVWNEGTTRRLELSISEGGQTVRYQYSFRVYDGCFVRPGGTNPGDGQTGNPATASRPEASVQAAITKAVGLYGAGPSTVRVAQGSYTVDGTVATMVEGVSLLGGYAATDWSKHNPSLYETVLANTATSGGSDVEPNHALKIPASVTVATSGRGLSFLIGRSSGFSAGIDCDGSPIIEDCRFYDYGETYGNSSGAVLRSAGMFRNNTITINWAKDAVAGVALHGSSAIVSSNSIFVRNRVTGGIAAAIVCQLDTAIPEIQDNSLAVSNQSQAPTQACILVMNSIKPKIEGNTMDAILAIYHAGTNNLSSFRGNTLNNYGVTIIHWSGENITKDNYASVKFTTEEGTEFISGSPWFNVVN